MTSFNLDILKTLQDQFENLQERLMQKKKILTI